MRRTPSLTQSILLKTRLFHMKNRPYSSGMLLEHLRWHLQNGKHRKFSLLHWHFWHFAAVQEHVLVTISQLALLSLFCHVGKYFPSTNILPNNCGSGKETSFLHKKPPSLMTGPFDMFCQRSPARW